MPSHVVSLIISRLTSLPDRYQFSMVHAIGEDQMRAGDKAGSRSPICWHARSCSGRCNRQDDALAGRNLPACASAGPARGRSFRAARRYDPAAALLAEFALPDEECRINPPGQQDETGSSLIRNPVTAISPSVEQVRPRRP